MIEAVRRERDVTVEQPYWKVFERALLVLVVIEVALGGNGYLIQLDGMRLRVLLFPICMAWTLLRLTRIDPVRVPFEVVCLFAFFVALTIFDTAIGYYHGNQVTAIVAEVKPLSYFPMLFFFIATIQKRSDVTLVAGLLAGCGTLLAVLYLLTIASVRFGFIDDYSLWQFLHVSDEFIFRGFPVIGFLYKGAIYIAIAAIFLIFDPFKVTKIFASVAVIAIAMTLTRGFALALVVCILTGLVLCREWKRILLFVGQAALLLVVLIFASQADPSMSRGDAKAMPTQVCQAPNKAIDASAENNSFSANSLQLAQDIQLERPSDTVRLADIKWVTQNLQWPTAIIGRGLGTPIRNSTRERIETNYFEILFKQGILGLAVWIALFSYILRLYLRVHHETRRVGLAFLLTVVFVFVGNVTDAILAGSMGMAPIFIATASLLALSNEEPRPMTEADWYGVGTLRLLRPMAANLGLIWATGSVILVLLLGTLRILGHSGDAGTASTVAGQHSLASLILAKQTLLRSASSRQTPIQAPSYNIATLPRLKPDQAVYFCNGQTKSALLKGWSESEPEGTWSEGHSAFIGLVVNGADGSGSPRQVFMHITPWLVPGKLMTQRVQVWIGDQEMAEYRLHSAPADLEIPLDGVTVKNGAPLILGFYLPDANSPHEVVNSTDYRMVAIRIEALELIW